MRCFSVFSGMLMLLLAASCGKPEVESEEPVPVTVTVAQPSVITATAVVPCRLEAGNEAVIHPVNPGRILKVFAREGDTVSRGEVLVELSTDQQYTAAVAASAARLQAAGTMAENRRADLRRAERLVAEGAVSPAEYEMALSSSESAQAEVEQARAAYRNARSMSDGGRILAPFEGTVARVWAREGQLSRGPLVSMAGPGILTAELLLAQRHIHRLDQGLPVIFETFHYAGELFHGEISSRASSVDPVSGLVPARVHMADSSGRLRPGMTGTATIALETSRDAVVLPMRMLLRDDRGNWMAAVLREGRAAIVPIETGIGSGASLEITSGVVPGDTVIDMGHHLVVNGSAVRVVER